MWGRVNEGKRDKELENGENKTFRVQHRRTDGAFVSFPVEISGLGKAVQQDDSFREIFPRLSELNQV